MRRTQQSLSEANANNHNNTEEIARANQQIEELYSENKSLKSYIESLDSIFALRIMEDIGKVSVRHQRRKLSSLKTKTEKALWFLKMFGLDIQDISFADDKDTQYQTGGCYGRGDW